MTREQDPRESGANQTTGPLGAEPADPLRPAMGAAAFDASAGASAPGTIGSNPPVGSSPGGLPPGGFGDWVRKEDILARFDVKALRSGVIVGLVAYFGSLIVALVLVMLAAAGLGIALAGGPGGAAPAALGGVPVPSLWPVVFPLAVQLVAWGCSRRSTQAWT